MVAVALLLRQESPSDRLLALAGLPGLLGVAGAGIAAARPRSGPMTPAHTRFRWSRNLAAPAAVGLLSLLAGSSGESDRDVALLEGGGLTLVACAVLAVVLYVSANLAALQQHHGRRMRRRNRLSLPVTGLAGLGAVLCVAASDDDVLDQGSGHGRLGVLAQVLLGLLDVERPALVQVARGLLVVAAAAFAQYLRARRRLPGL